MTMTPSRAEIETTSCALDDRVQAHHDSELAATSFGNIQFSIQDAITEVAGIIAPVWPLRDYVAVNPYAGLASKRFLDARQFLQSFSDCEMLMPLEYYAAAFREQRFNRSNIQHAIEELSSEGLAIPQTVGDIAARLASVQDFTADVHEDFLHRSFSGMQTVAEVATGASGVNWVEVIRDEVSKHCSAHYDEGQATWSSPTSHLSLYAAWRATASCDRNVEFLGLRGFRHFVAQLPSHPEAAIAQLLTQLRVPPRLRSTFLMCQAYSIPGWSAWAKYQTDWKDSPDAVSLQVEGGDLAGLLAIRLAYDVALASVKSLTIQWDGFARGLAIHGTFIGDAKEEIAVRMVLLRASEMGFRNTLLQSLKTSISDSPPIASQPKLAQMVFCIDVRSERIRRHIESLSQGIETFGYAGFFGMPIESVPLGAASGDSHVPALLKPKFKLHESLPIGEPTRPAHILSKRTQIRTWRRIWTEFQTSAVSCFAFVETTGVFYGWKLAKRAFGIHSAAATGRFDAVPPELCDRVGPVLQDLARQGLPPSHQADLAESMLRGVGLTTDFAPLVVLCGHASQTDNNPLAAGLDCGACGGHSGEPNARLAAMLLNQPSIRTLLAERGIDIPSNTHFLAGLHNTTTDKIQYFESHRVPDSHQKAMASLTELSDRAGDPTRLERMLTIKSESTADLFRRAVDWSEVRPEWALAGNAAFIIAPRRMTRGVNLAGRSFLHSYDHQQDPDGTILEAIMTAPLIVAHWINMQYFASTVDNKHFGSGTKTIHNVVGQFGILSGNAGDLRTGLPWQSVHNGVSFQHSPMRLQAVVAAPLLSIDRVLEKHPAVAELVEGDWLHLTAIDGALTFRRDLSGGWIPVQGELSGMGQTE